VHIVTIKRLQQASEDYRDAAQEIGSWGRVVKAARWRSFLELCESFPDADDVDGFVVFNIRRNRYRLIVAVHYAKVIGGALTLGHVYIGSFCRTAMQQLHRYIDQRLEQWARRKYKTLLRHRRLSVAWLRKRKDETPGLFHHWSVVGNKVG
jgi:mRNA interferase HigB